MSEHTGTFVRSPHMLALLFIGIGFLFGTLLGMFVGINAQKEAMWNNAYKRGCATIVNNRGVAVYKWTELKEKADD